MVFVVSLLQSHSIKKGILFTYHKDRKYYLHTMFFSNESFSIALEYTAQPYAESISMRPDLSCITYDKSSREEADDIINFAKFESGGLISENCDNM